MLASLENRRVPIHRTLCDRGNDNYSTSQDSAAFAERVKNVTSDFFLRKQPQKHQQIRMSSPKTT
jgi:hypothetical protein